MERKILTRRGFLKVSIMSVGAIALAKLGLPEDVLAEDPASVFNMLDDTSLPEELRTAHTMEVRLPLIAQDGSNVPIIIGMPHPMEPDHYIKSLQIVGFNDPIVVKGVYQFSPANGEAYLSTQMRMDGGDTGVYVISECSQHGKWVSYHSFKVSLGGC